MDAFVDVSWNSGLRQVILNHKAIRQGDRMHLFAHTITPRMEAGEQARAGRCWIFAGLNLLRRTLAKSLNLPDKFQLSHSYVQFYDKLEKANAFLRHVCNAYREPAQYQEHIVRHLLAEPISDGGDWHTFVNLVTKYGVVPETHMPDSYPASNTGMQNRLLKSLLLQSAHRLRDTRSDLVEVEITSVMQRVHRLLCMCYGHPPLADASFAWTYKTSGDEVITSHVTPIEVFDKCNVQLRDFVSLVNLPSKRGEKLFGRAYTVKYMSTVWGSPCAYSYNVEDLERYVLSALRNGRGVYFASEFNEMRAPAHGILHHELLKPERVIDEELIVDKGTRIDAMNTDINHAMLFTGFHEEDGETRYQVENSHGTDNADGYLSMTNTWFHRHVFQVAVHKDDAKDLFNLHEWPKQTLEPWDILGIVLR